MQKLFSLFALFSLLTFAGLVEGQVTPGNPSFTAYDSHGVDTINLQNLNILLHVPVRSKSGAFPFSFELQGQYYMSQSGSSWLPYAVTQGTMSSPAAIFMVSYTNGLYTLCPDGVHYTNTFSGWYIQFLDGTIRWLPSADMTDLRTDGSGLSCFNMSFTDQVIDGSGYTLTVTLGSPVSVYDRSGMNIGTNASLATQKTTDSNGNSMSWGGVGAYPPIVDTLGVTVLTPGGGGSAPTMTWTDVNGGSPQVAGTSTSTHLKSVFGCSTSDYDRSMSLMTGFSFPDGTSLGIAFEGTPGITGDYTGRLGQLTLRTGGTIAYGYSGSNHGLNCTYQVPPTLTRTTSDGTTTYTWASVNNGSGNWGNTTTVTDQGSNKTLYTFTGLTATGNAALPITQALTEMQHYQGASTLLTTDVYCYNAKSGQPGNCSTAVVSLPITEVDVYHTISGMSTSSRTQTKYDKYGNVIYSAQYDFGASSPTNTTTITYGTCSANCTAASPTISAVGSNVNDKPGRVVKTQNGSTVSESRFTYDAHGNLLTRYLWTGSAYLSNSTANVYNPNGTPSKIFDLANHETDYTYASSGYSNCSSCTQYPFATSIRNVGTGVTVGATYDGLGGVKSIDVDPNGNVTTYCYNTGASCSGGAADPYWRALQVIDPYGATVVKTYPNGSSPDVGGSSFTFNSGNSINSTTITTDGYGRPTNSQTAQSPSGTNYDTESTAYGYSSNYRTVATSQPCSIASGSSCSTVHTNEYDPLGRLYTESTTSNETLTNTYANNDVSSVLTPVPSGENSKQTAAEYDGLGRVTWICKHGHGISSACATGSSYTGLADSYAYTVPTAGSTKVAVTRGGQTRYQVFDALGRLTHKFTPEGGTWTYYYDTAASACAGSVASAGNMTCMVDPNGNQSIYTYDSLNRLTNVGAGVGGSTTCKRFGYDNYSGILGALPTGVTLANQYGRLVEAETDDCTWPPQPPPHQITDEWFAYDKDGRVTDMWESTPHITQYYHSVATFFENGATKTVQLASPALYTITYGLEGEGRIKTVADGAQSIVTGATYFPATNPAVVSLTGATPDTSAYTFDANTGRMTDFLYTIGSTPKTFEGALLWNPNGTLKTLTIIDGFNALGTQTCHFNSTDAPTTGYDDWMRLVGVDCGSGNWGQDFSYDNYDNLTKSVISGRTGVTWTPTYSPSTNHYACAGCTSDNNGDVTADGNNVYGWNEFAKLKWVAASGTPTCGSGGNCLVYDAFGRIVEQSNGSTWQQIWLTQAGHVIMSGITANNGVWDGPMAGKAIVSGNSGGFYYAHPDWLGSSRISSNITARSFNSDQAYAPYGEVYDAFGSTGTVFDIFAGTTSDFFNGVTDETPNRELSAAAAGRWLSPDPAGSGWNQYAYPTNPNSFIDPSGLSDCALTSKICDPRTGGHPFGGGGGISDPSGGLENLLAVYDWTSPSLSFSPGTIGYALSDDGKLIFDAILIGGNNAILSGGGWQTTYVWWWPSANGLFSPPYVFRGPGDVISRPHKEVPHIVTPTQADAYCGLLAQQHNDAFNDEGFHFPSPGNSLYPAQGQNVWNNLDDVNPSDVRPAEMTNPSGPEPGEGYGGGGALMGYAISLYSDKTQCMRSFGY